MNRANSRWAIIAAMTDAEIKASFDIGGITRFSILSLAATDKAQNDRVSRVCGISKKDRQAVILEALSMAAH